jgi:hypothetical protein
MKGGGRIYYNGPKKLKKHSKDNSWGKSKKSGTY